MTAFPRPFCILGGGGSTAVTSPSGIAATQVAYGSGTNQIKGEAAFAYDESTNTLTADNIVPGVGQLTAPSVKFATSNGVGFYLVGANGAGYAGSSLTFRRTDGSFTTSWDTSGSTVSWGTTFAGGILSLTSANGVEALKLDASAGATFAGKVGVNGATPSSTTGLILTAGTTGVSSMRVPSGVAPTSPVSGDLWYDGTNLKFRDGGTTRTITWV